MTVRATTSRVTAAGTVFGGRKISDAAMARATRTRAAITQRRPMWPVSAIRWPGSGLTAWEATLARPSGNEIVFLTIDSGWRTANGPTRTRKTPSATLVMMAADRFPSRARARAIATTTAGQAVALSEAAPPKARPARIGRGYFHISAKPRQISAVIGTSVPPTVSSRAMIGVAVTNTVQRATSRALATRSASAKHTTNATPNQIRGSASGLFGASAHGRAQTLISGRDALLMSGFVLCLSRLGDT